MGELFKAFGIEWQLLLAQAINFAIVLLALTYFLYKPVLKLLAERQEKIAKGVRDAEAAAEARSKVEAEKTGIIALAERDAEGIVSRAEAQAKEERAMILTAAQERAETVLSDAASQGEVLKQEVLKESEKEIVRAAVLAAEKILQKA